jgi:catechol 2,3-dioxygenase-like lactoylglutathione lyase family enzyme
MIRGVHHVSLATADIDKCIHFYRDLMGMKLDRATSVGPGLKAFEVIVGLQNTQLQSAAFNLGNLHMEVFCYHNPKPQPGEKRPASDVGIRHIAFDVKDIFTEYERLKAAGVEFISPPQHVPEGKCTSVYFYDPDGNIVEMQELFEGTPVSPAFGITD